MLCARSCLDPEPSGGTAQPPAAGQLAGDPLARSRPPGCGQARPADGGWCSGPSPSRNQARRALFASGLGAAPGRERAVASRSRARGPGTRRPRPESRPCGPAGARGHGRPRRPATARPRGVPGCAGSAARSWRGRYNAQARAPLRRPSFPPASSRVWAAGHARGRQPAARIPLRPSRPAPRSKLSSNVSAWSSAVWPTMDALGQGFVAGGRARASRSRPGATVTATISNVRPAPGRRSYHLRFLAAPGRRPWSTYTAAAHDNRQPRPGPASPSSPARPDTAHATIGRPGERTPAEQGTPSQRARSGAATS